MLAARTWLLSSLPLAAMHIALREALKIGTQSIVSIVFWVVDFFSLCFLFLNFIFVVFVLAPSDFQAFLVKRCVRSGFPSSPRTQITVLYSGELLGTECAAYWGEG